MKSLKINRLEKQTNYLKGIVCSPIIGNIIEFVAWPCYVETVYVML